MGLAVLVLEMPKSCRDCPFTSKHEESECMALIYSKRTHHLNSYEYWHDEKAENCPLKPLPKKQELKRGWLKDGEEILEAYINGYNACIEDITDE